MHWASFDSFLIDDVFWHDKMGMPVANRQFLEAFFRYGRFSSCRFFCKDTVHTEMMSRFLDGLALETGMRGRARAIPKALAWDHLRREPADVMHHGDFTFYMPYVMEWRNRTPAIAPFAVTGVTHSLDTLSIYSKCLNLLLAQPKPYDAIICSSACAEKMLSQTFDYIRGRFVEVFHAELPKPPRLIHIPLGIPDRPGPLTAREEARRRLGWQQDEVALLYLGRFSVRQKMDFSPLLEGYSWLVKKFGAEKRPEKLRLVLSGAGKKEDIRLVTELCRFVGLGSQVTVEANVSQERKDLLYCASDIFCSLVDNYQETFGLTILEAMSHGLPVIASDFGGYRELVEPWVTGFLIPTYASPDPEPWESLAGILDLSVIRYHRAQKVAFDIESFLNALAFLATRPEARRSMGRAAMLKAERYRWSVVLTEYRNLWEALAREALKDRNEPMRKTQSLQVLTPEFVSIFGHYPSDTLRQDSCLTVGFYGRERLAEGFVPIIYSESEIVIIKEVLSLIKRLDLAKGYRVSEIVSVVEHFFGLPQEAAQLHVDWLVKHGILCPQKN